MYLAREQRFALMKGTIVGAIIVGLLNLAFIVYVSQLS
ncbi:hypothetical protein NIES2104_54370 [Leptolyngbya sp. NIES-2104]|nr:hypothetical protein NIES2104_54370 [Leptolyngbya sp. NIES-2104]